MNLLSAFTLADGIILVAVLTVIALVVFFGFIRKGKKSDCKGCPYAKNCSSQSGDCRDKDGKTPDIKKSKKTDIKKE